MMMALDYYLLVGLALTEVVCLDQNSLANYKPHMYLFCVMLWPLVMLAILYLVLMIHVGGNDEV